MACNPLSKMLAIVAFCMSFGTVAQAQFAGDFFFEEPSVPVAVGAQGTVLISIFSAADSFGVAHGKVTFDAAQIDVVDVALPVTGGADLVQELKVEPGEISFLVVNGTSITGPIGTVGLLELTISPKAAAGTTVPITLERLGALNSAAANYPNSNATSGEVVIVAPTSAQFQSGEPRRIENPTGTLLARAARLVSPGGWVDLAIVNGTGQVEKVSVKVPGNAAQSE